jgi:hypothetical protein
MKARFQNSTPPILSRAPGMATVSVTPTIELSCVCTSDNAVCTDYFFYLVSVLPLLIK